MQLDWDKLRIFHAAAEAGSFTHAAEILHLSQSAISRQVSALETEVNTKLFHRHARGLILTEQGEILYKTAHEVLMKLEMVKTQLTETREKPSGKLRITTTVGLGQGWLTEKVHEFQAHYPDMQVQLILDNEELDVNMRQADCAIRLRQPQQSDLIQRKLFTVHLHIYASPAYLARYGEPKTIKDLDDHRLITFGEPAPVYLHELTWLERAGRTPDNPRPAHLQINNLAAVRRATINGAGVSMLPDYMINRDDDLVRLAIPADFPTFDTYFCYAEEMRNAAKLKVFRDFLINKARNWNY
ncbi:LysR family transcriptional regulator [Pseudohoeflea suaedae]|uniref:LysR family transcriptional regulator n=1 Tax=Pseudohoeflea suaedae TaxID=877384 RepID=A0A4R5PHN6_9HYPH|nr:LysR family transcriptional regulator [Pseudohoeflea suaedae]TDH34342.1 LysR family transcriptional regulator [Pseudohoeflea suaedae]